MSSVYEQSHVGTSTQGHTVLRICLFGRTMVGAGGAGPADEDAERINRYPVLLSRYLKGRTIKIAAICIRIPQRALAS